MELGVSFNVYMFEFFIPQNFANILKIIEKTNYGSIYILLSKRYFMKVLNVAEKNDAAKNLAGIMSGGNIRRREGISKYNKIYEFDYTLLGQRCTMVMTSVSGHLLNYEFSATYRKWNSCNPLALFDAPVMKSCPQDYMQIKQTLQREVRTCDTLIIWTDCDREGENIGFEIIQVCSEIKPRLNVYRAKFSEITGQSISRAIRNLGEPDRRISNAVDVRQELDLRIGAAFTRFQTLRLKTVFPATLQNSLISYGSCQFPTLGFVVERYKAIQEFIPEMFWKIKVNHTIEDISVDFKWKRVRLMDEPICRMLFELCEENPLAKVEKVQSKPKSNWRPLPLDTVELEKLASRKLKINAKETMKIAEKLYVQGFISYPRTETNIFPKELDLRRLVEQQVPDGNWGEFAARVLQDGPNPRQGKKTDQAHPPIHPTKHTTGLSGNEKQVYEFVVRHFLACCSKDAEGMETVVEIDIANEKFVASGLAIIARNYLDVYPYKKWEGREIHNYSMGETFEPTSLDMVDGETQPPDLLTEADLISLMEKHGIGTDATHAEHIETIKSRNYVGLKNGTHFMPSHLGMGLVEGYDSMGYPMSKPHLRAELEQDLKSISVGTKNPAAVLAQQVAKYKAVFQRALEQASKIDEALGKYFNEQINVVNYGGDNQNNGMIGLAQETFTETFPCSTCNSPMILKQRSGDTNAYYISCSTFPECRNAIWFPSHVLQIEVMDETCETCGPQVHKLRLKCKRGSMMPFYPDEYEGCVGGCDQNLLECLHIQSVRVGNTARQNITATQRSNNATTISNQTRDSGFHSSNSSRQTPQDFPSNQSSYRRVQNNPGTSTNFRNPVPESEDGSAILCHCRQNALKLTVRKEGPNTGRQFYKCGQDQGSGCDFFLWATDADDNQNSGSNAWDGGGGGGGGWGGGGGGVGGGWGGGGGGVGGGWDGGGGGSRNDFTGGPSGSGGRQGGRGRGGRGDGLSDVSWGRGGIQSNFNQTSSANFSYPTSNDSSEVMCNCREPGRRLTVQKEGPNKGRQFYACPKPRNEQCGFFKWADEVDAGDSGSGWDASSKRAKFGSPYRARGRGQGSSGRGRGGSTDESRKRKCGICREEGHTRNNCPNNKF